MIDLKLDVRAFERRAKELNGQIDQLPYALAQAMNKAAFATRANLIEQTWPKHVTVRRPNFLRAALRVATATKRNLVVAIEDVLHRGSLALHDNGGPKRGKGMLAIPMAGIKAKRTGAGVPKRLRPRALAGSFKKGDVIYQRAKSGKVTPMYLLRKMVNIRGAVPFTEDFQRQMLTHLSHTFPAAMAKAMASRRRS